MGPLYCHVANLMWGSHWVPILDPYGSPDWAILGLILLCLLRYYFTNLYNTFSIYSYYENKARRRKVAASVLLKLLNNGNERRYNITPPSAWVKHYFKVRHLHQCVVIYFFWSSGIRDLCCVHLHIEFRSCVRECQWCGTFYYIRQTASIKPGLLFSHACYAFWWLSFSPVLFNRIPSWYK